MKIIVQTADFDVNAELCALRKSHPNVGALASFVGTVRARTNDVNHGHSVDAANADTNATNEINEINEINAMELEHYPQMTEQALATIAKEACKRFDVIDVVIIHRVGVLAVSDQIVLVAVASQHRGSAFDACEYIMDYLKTDAPFWKKEFTAQGAKWVDAREVDRTALLKWA